MKVCLVVVSFLSGLVCVAQTSAQVPAGVTGAGTKNFVPVWTGASTLGNSLIYETGGNVGVGTKTPKAAVDIVGKGTLGLQVTAPGAQAAISGISNDVNGSTGVYGQSNSTLGNALFGHSLSTTGGAGLIAQTENTDSTGTVGIFLAHGGGGLILGGYSGINNNLVFRVDANGNGFYAGNLHVGGTLTKGAGSFKIDHPLDPAHKYLSHSFVESPDMMNIYNGVVVLDAHGSAWVMLPDYFDALNRDFRYQLTSIGVPGPNLYIAKEVSGNCFKIAGGKPHARVSWQVTGVRQDAYANAYRIPTEEEKPATEQGYYLHPEVFGQPASKSIQAASQKASTTGQMAKMSNQ